MVRLGAYLGKMNTEVNNSKFPVLRAPELYTEESMATAPLILL
jgi:hypothetical protein